MQYKLMKVTEIEASAKRRSPEIKFTKKDHKLKAQKIAALEAADAGGNPDPGDPLEAEAAAEAAKAAPAPIPTAEALAAADGTDVGSTTAPASKQTWMLCPDVGINDANIDIACLLSTFLKPFTLAQQQLQTVTAPIGHLISRILRRTMRATELNWIGKNADDKFCGAYQEWREGMQGEGKDDLVQLLDGIGESMAQCTRVAAEAPRPRIHAVLRRSRGHRPDGAGAGGGGHREGGSHVVGSGGALRGERTAV